MSNATHYLQVIRNSDTDTAVVVKSSFDVIGVPYRAKGGVWNNGVPAADLARVARQAYRGDHGKLVSLGDGVYRVDFAV